MIDARKIISPHNERRWIARRGTRGRRGAKSVRYKMAAWGYCVRVTLRESVASMATPESPSERYRREAIADILELGKMLPPPPASTDPGARP